MSERPPSDEAWLTPGDSPLPPPAPSAGLPEVPPPADETVRVKPPRRLLTPRVVTSFFVIGSLLLVVGLITVVRLSDRVYARPVPGTSAGPRPVKPSPVPSELLRNRLGPTRVAMGKSIVVTGEGDAKFRVTVEAGKFRRSGCNEFAVKPELGGYLPAEVTVKVLEGEPDVSVFDFKFQQPDGAWLDSVGGTGCDKGFGELIRRLVAGRTYRTTVVFGVPNARGDVVFTWPLTDVYASWRVS